MTGEDSRSHRTSGERTGWTRTSDASVLYPLPLRDTLLRVAEIELYDPYHS
jgi:hypothetical protein